MKPKVLYLAPFTTTLKDKTGGVCKYIKYLKYISEKNGFQVDINNNSSFSNLNEYSAIHMFSSSVNSLDWIKIEHPNCVLTPVYDRAFANWQSIMAQSIGNLPSIYTSENVRLKILRRARVILTFSEFEKAYLARNFKLDDDHLRVLGADYQPIPVSARKRSKFLFVGDVSNPRKNLKRICEVFANSRAHLTIIGRHREDRYTQSVMSIVNKATNIDYLGVVNDDAIIDAYKGHDALVLVSLFEGFGYAAIEANQHQLPVLGTLVGGTRELLGGNGVYVNPYSKTSIRKGIERIMAGDCVSENFSAPLGSQFSNLLKRTYHGY